MERLLLDLAAGLVDLDLPRDLALDPLRATKLNEFMFFSSVRVRSSSEPAGRTETLTSQRSEPFSISASEMPSSTTVWRSSWRKRFASSAERMSGCVTISTSGVPPRLKSTSDALGAVDPPVRAADVDVFAASSSRCARTMPDLVVAVGAGHDEAAVRRRAARRTGRSGTPFGRSG